MSWLDLLGLRRLLVWFALGIVVGVAFSAAAAVLL
jgi:hypothetical protein